MAVRRISPDDAPRIVELTQLFAQEEALLARPKRVANKPPPWHEKLLPMRLQNLGHSYEGLNQTQVREHLVAAPPLFEGFLAELDGAVVGMVAFVRSYNSWLGPILRIETLFVTQDARHQGIGRDLVITVVNNAISHGYARVEGPVIESNKEALRFYANLGAAIDCDLRGFRWDLR